ncbi:GNS1/SUR4 family-domain-containing protein [Dendryphion nanum]|uniref:Elongation of fatty acids protein n=1 Tax=Dendryphion nanum TaxID=256645 RepID=A0A9P9E0I6_9PLEO|nr:GNS1/SUR4 family-domain-containing protein [Dendryphion nanum]
MSGAGPSLFPGELPSWTVFKFPPDPAPAPIPPPFEGFSFKTPFPIPTDLFTAALSFKVPLTIASVYATTVILLNKYNRSNGNKPWAISKTRAFYAFVILHNVFLAVYSAVTCVAMVRALKHSIPHYTEPNAVAGAVDALCKIHGPRGLGDAATWNNNQSRWEIKNRLIHLDSNGQPDPSDVGRIWNEGLAFWGWIFYLSKFYEVLDTFIIIAKGKRSSTLQTYHHAGAMLCMWAGIRYMSPPIWMFALVNSGIHALMYSYYTISALGVRVPQAIKRSLTTLQITQFLVGCTFAGLHLFVSYTVPVSVPHQIKETLTSAVPVISSSASSLVPSSTSISELAAATGAAVAFLKKLVYRAAGEEGLAENIQDPSFPRIVSPGVGLDRPQHVSKNVVERTVYRTEYHHVPCIDTSGQAFAIYLNLMYLAPLTGLFMRFFVKSYLRRTAPGKHATKHNVIAKSSRDAIHGVDREIESLGKAAEDGLSSALSNGNGSIRGRKVKVEPKRAGSLSPANQKFIDSVKRKVDQRLEEIGEGAEATQERARAIAKEVVSEREEKKANGYTNGHANGNGKANGKANGNGKS